MPMKGTSETRHVSQLGIGELRNRWFLYHSALSSLGRNRPFHRQTEEAGGEELIRLDAQLPSRCL